MVWHQPSTFKIASRAGFFPRVGDLVIVLQSVSKAPLRLVGASREGDGEVRTRKRGMHVAHALEKFFGEIALSAMAFTVNQETRMLSVPAS